MSMISNAMASIGHHPYYWIIAGFLACIFLNRRMRNRQRNPNRLPLPPGPKGLPIIGSTIDMPREQSWRVYDDWCKIYGLLLRYFMCRRELLIWSKQGDMAYSEVLGQSFLLLGSLRRTTDLFDRRSFNYSDRPRTPMLIEL